MRNSFVMSLVLIVGAIGLFFGVTEPAYQTSKTLAERNSRLDGALQQARSLQERRNQLNSKFNLMREQDLQRLLKFLPDSIDTVRLVLDVDTRARANSLTVSGFELQNVVRNITATAGDVLPTNQPLYGTVDLTFQVVGSYENFITLLTELQESLRLVDIISIELTNASGSEDRTRKRVHEYSVRLRTYWLR